MIYSSKVNTIPIIGRSAMLNRKPPHFSIMVIALSVLLLAVGGCSEDDPTQPTNTNAGDVTLSDAKVSVEGQSLDGQDIQQGSHSGPVRYEARLTDHHGDPIVGGRVQVRYGMSGMMGHMNNEYMHLGEFDCYDDGTHGDLTPRDGIYCFIDDGQQYGCHRAGARLGEYQYEFCGFDQHGQTSNRVDVRVNLVQ